jgi:hypothetical protein
VGSGVDRKEFHEVTVGLALGGPKLVAPTGQKLVTAHAQTPGEQNAVEAVNQFLMFKLSQPSGDVSK